MTPKDRARLEFIEQAVLEGLDSGEVDEALSRAEDTTTFAHMEVVFALLDLREQAVEGLPPALHWIVDQAFVTVARTLAPDDCD